MINKIKTLLWLRYKLIQKNKAMLMQIIVPFILGAMYDAFMNEGGANSILILSVVLNMTFATGVGTVVSTIIAEEKEKNNMRALMLSGVSSGAYIISTLIYPIIIGLIAIVSMPYLLAINLEGIVLQYYSVTILTCLATTLLYLIIALFSETQSVAQVYNSIALAFVMFIPMLAGANEGVAKVLRLTHMNGFDEFIKSPHSYHFSQSSFSILILWIMGLLVTAIALYKKDRVRI